MQDECLELARPICGFFNGLETAWIFHNASCRETGWGWDTPENSAVVALSGNKNLVGRRSPHRLIQIFRRIAVFAPLRRKFGCSLLTPARRKRNQQEEHMLLRNPRLFPIVGVPFLALVFRISKGPDLSKHGGVGLA